MNTEAKRFLELVSDDEIDDLAELTIVMSSEELEMILAIDAAHASREATHQRPTLTMPAVKML